jgi:uncharacterized membrane protein
MRNVQSFGFTAALYVAFLLLTGCAQIGLAPASSFDQRLAYAVSQNAAVRQAAANSLNAGEIEVADAQFVLKTTDEARTLLDAARLASGTGDVSTAEGRLSVAVTVLTNLQMYLRTRSKS